MGGVTSALPHLSEFEVSIRLRQTAGREQRRWFVIWNALVDPRPASEIAIHTDVSVSTVHNVISRYNRFGPEAIESCDNGIRRRCYLSKDQEAEFLKPFFEPAATGKICVAGQIKKSLEDLLDHKHPPNLDHPEYDDYEDRSDDREFDGSGPSSVSPAQPASSL